MIQIQTAITLVNMVTGIGWWSHDSPDTADSPGLLCVSIRLSGLLSAHSLVVRGSEVGVSESVWVGVDLLWLLVDVSGDWNVFVDVVRVVDWHVHAGDASGWLHLASVG